MSDTPEGANPNDPPAVPGKKALIATEVENLENKLKSLFGGVHDEVAEIIAKIRAHLA